MKKHSAFQWKIPLSLSLLFFILFPNINQAQSVKRQCISSYAPTVSTERSALSQTAGQSYSTVRIAGSNISVFQGFQQPVVFKSEIEIPAEMEIMIYPNPASCQFFIQSGNKIENSEIHVWDMYGKLITSFSLPQLYTSVINCAGWGNGTFIVTVEGENKNTSSFKLIINK